MAIPTTIENILTTLERGGDPSQKAQVTSSAIQAFGANQLRAKQYQDQLDRLDEQFALELKKFGLSEEQVKAQLEQLKVQNAQWEQSFKQQEEQWNKQYALEKDKMNQASQQWGISTGITAGYGQPQQIQEAIRTATGLNLTPNQSAISAANQPYTTATGTKTSAINTTPSNTSYRVNTIPSFPNKWPGQEAWARSLYAQGKW